ncbi:INO80 complex subunit E-like [Myzus persicae]|uniref:INO80 complex subunit E-like n=1 Tax=Myzus persicae TaxID=13164 RepID=UPI000B93745B|nr:INO80 complex subunit E-like [Myzus persicae]
MGSESPKTVTNEETFDENSLAEANAKEQYKEMKRKLRLLVYENEIFQQTLKTTQRKLLRASRDKNALLDRLIKYEMVDLSSSDDELTESSDEGDSIKPEPNKKRKDPPANNSSGGTSKQSISPQRTTPNPAKKRKPSTPKASKSAPMPLQSNEPHSNSVLSTAESSKKMGEPKSGNNFGQHSLKTEMFNDTFSVKSESNSMYDIDTSPNNTAEDMISVDSIGK